MKFLGGSAAVHGAHDNACSYADRHVGGEGASDPVHVGRDLSLCIPFKRPSLFYILQEEAYRRAGVPTAFANFSSTAKRNGRQFGTGICVLRVCIRSP